MLNLQETFCGVFTAPLVRCTELFGIEATQNYVTRLLRYIASLA